jgi:8-oxo-dGTP pyrophosphatase MutT (NUDIX family)
MSQTTHAGAVVVRFSGAGPEYLLVEASTNPEHKLFPKGHIEKGEEPPDTALREVREEAGVGGEILGFIETSNLTVGGETFGVDYYLVRFLREVEREEERGRYWCTYEDAMRTLTFEEDRDLLSTAHPVVLRYLREEERSAGGSAGPATNS